MNQAICSACGSANVRVSPFQRKDFPARFCFVECGDCGQALGVVDSSAIHDAFRRREKSQRKLADIVFSRRNAETT